MIEINPSLLLAQVVTFLIALFIVWKISWGPLQQLMKSRQERIRNDLQNAEQTRQAAARLESDYRFRLSQIEQQIKELITIAKLEGNRERDEIIKNARQEIAEIHKRALEQLELEKEDAMQQLRSKVIDISVSLSGKIMENQDLSAYSASQISSMVEALERAKESRNES